MTEQEKAAEKAVKAIESARSHVEYFKGKEAEHRALIEAGGPFDVDEAHSFAMADYYRKRVAEHEANGRTAEAELAALKRPPLA